MLDLHVAVRALRAAPLVSAIAALSLMLGIGANAAMFSLVNTLLLRPLPVVEPDRLVTISSPTAISMGFPAGLGWSYAMWERFRPHSAMFAGALAWSSQRLDLLDQLSDVD
jgi:putative ABC transport system permease protein